MHIIKNKNKINNGNVVKRGMLQINIDRFKGEKRRKAVGQKRMGSAVCCMYVLLLMGNQFMVIDWQDFSTAIYLRM